MQARRKEAREQGQGLNVIGEGKVLTRGWGPCLQHATEHVLELEKAYACQHAAQWGSAKQAPAKNPYMKCQQACQVAKGNALPKEGKGRQRVFYGTPVGRKAKSACTQAHSSE